MVNKKRRLTLVCALLLLPWLLVYAEKKEAKYDGINQVINIGAYAVSSVVTYILFSNVLVQLL